MNVFQEWLASGSLGSAPLCKSELGRYWLLHNARQLRSKHAAMFAFTYALAWTLTFLLLLASLGTLVGGALSLADHSSPFHPRGNHPERAALLAAVCLGTTLLYLLTSNPRSYARWRSGRLWGGGWLFSTPTISTEQTIERATRLQRSASDGESVEVVGGAWSNVLRREAVRGVPLEMSLMRGKAEGGRSRWLAGTPLWEVHRDLKKRGLVAVNVPSYSGVTIGAWVATMGHGMPGRAFDHDIVCVSALVLDLKTSIVSFDGPSKLEDKFGGSRRRAAQFLVLEVELSASPTLVSDAPCVRSSRWLAYETDSRWLLDKSALAAVVFVGYGGALALRWAPVKPGQRRPSRGARRALDDASYALFSVTGRFLSKADGLEHTQPLSNAVYLFSVYLWPAYTLSFLLLPLRNTELYTTDLDLSPAKLLEVSTALTSHFKVYNGRCEVRFLGVVTFFDIFSWSSDGLRALVRVLADLGVQRVAMHPGKFQADVTGWPVAMVDPASV